MFTFDINEKDDLWCIEDPGFNEDSSKYYEGLLTQGNGYMHVRGSFEEGVRSVKQDEEYDRKPANVTLEKHKKQSSKWGTYIPGVVGKHPYLFTEIVNLPFFMAASFAVKDEDLDMEESDISEYERYLDMRDGTLVRRFVWNTKEGLKLKMEYFRFLSFADKHLAFSEIKITALSGEGDLSFRSGIDAGVRTNGFNHFENVLFTEDSDSISVSLKTNGGNSVLMSTKLFLSDAVETAVMQDLSRINYIGRKHLKTGECFVIHKVVAANADCDVEGGNMEARNVSGLYAVKKENLADYYEAHKKVWKNKWDDAEIKIVGDEKTEKALKFSTYHLLRADNDENPNVAICAKGYAGEAYCGRYFWDTEINMLPFFIHTNPQGAKNLLMFRYNTLAGAKRNARAYGYKGARFPWESSVSGEEECACWQYADHEIHVTADIVYAIMHYVKATGDRDFIKNYGIDIMVETARYWVDRVDKDMKGRYVLLSVMGPDEYLPMTNNNAYTNHMVKFALDTTVSCIEELKEKGEFDEIKSRLNITDEDMEAFKDVAANIKISFNKDTEIILQCDGFYDFADLDFSRIWKDRSRCFGEFISQEKNYRSKALKQADVLEMMMLFPDEFTRQQFISNYDYYEPITTHDSSLSAAVHGIIAARIGRDDVAMDFLKRVIDIDLSADKKGAEEGIHIANCGGLWQMVVYGFAGMKSGMWSDEVTFAPNLPEKWQQVIIPINWHGEKKRYVIDKNGFELR
jgi:kojibiose phosphorylase